jgi:dihydroorotate dehydrogenase subfamily 2
MGGFCLTPLGHAQSKSSFTQNDSHKSNLQEYAQTMLTGTLYRRVIKPILFRFPADDVHEFFLRSGDLLGRLPLVRSLLRHSWAYKNDTLTQQLHGITFPNPIGLSAGFDYEANLIEILPSLGFGFHSMGTLTHKSYGGNPPPMLGRLPKSQSLLVNKGFKNLGITKTLTRVRGLRSTIPLGISVGATNQPYENFDDMAEDASLGFQEADVFHNFDYFELNISCPNLINIKNLTTRLDSPEGFRTVLEKLTRLNLQRPVFVKMPSEKSQDDIVVLMGIAAEYAFIKGLIFSNLVKDRSNPSFDAAEVQSAGMGNFSGKPVSKLSNELISHAYSRFGKRFTIIGVGGVFTAEDAYEKIRLGASLIQLITGMVYMGPQQIGVINRGLVRLLKRDGFKNVGEAVGAATSTGHF